MPHYVVVFSNQSDTEVPANWSQTEYLTAPDMATVEQLVRRDCGRFVNVELYTWTITETDETSPTVGRHR